LHSAIFFFLSFNTFYLSTSLFS